MKALAALLLLPICATSSAGLFPSPVSDVDAVQGVQLAWGVKIPLRDGVHLNATVYTLAPADCSPAAASPGTERSR